MNAFVIFLQGGRMLAWNKKPVPPNGQASGWRPYIWTDKLIDAEKFASREAGELFARHAIPHDEWSVIQVAAAPIPGDAA